MLFHIIHTHINQDCPTRLLEIMKASSIDDAFPMAETGVFRSKK
jgi:hypothetical protein